MVRNSRNEFSTGERVPAEVLAAVAYFYEGAFRGVGASATGHREVTVERGSFVILVGRRIDLRHRFRHSHLLRLRLLQPVTKIVVVPVDRDRRDEDRVQGMLAGISQRLRRGLPSQG